MSVSAPLPLPPEDKLDLLRYLDEFHYWHSLDDERLCKRCGRRITGLQITIIELQGTRGKLRLQCPSAGCVSTPGDWVYADPILAAKLRRDFRPVTRASKAPAAEPERAHHGHAFRVRRGARRARAPLATAATTNHVSLRAVIARLSLLRTLATALHAIRPVA